MCFSAESSIISFNLGILGSILCISLGSILSKAVGYFLGFVSLMQGIEYLIWTHQKCDTYNKRLSILGMILNHLQPVVLGIILLILNPTNQYINWIITIILLYLCVIIPYSTQMINKDYQCTIKGDKHLLWKWNLMNYNGLVYTIFLITMIVVSLLGFPEFKDGMYFSTVTFFTYITSLYLYPADVMGAMWCYYTAFIPILYFIINKEW